MAITAGRVQPSLIEVWEGDQVTLRVSTEQPVELHRHGNDLARSIQSGGPSEPSFTAHSSGQLAAQPVVEDDSATAGAEPTTAHTNGVLRSA